MANPSCSVIIPTFNRERYVVEAVQSALAQSYAPVEVIVVDDGSTDGTEGALEAFASRIRYIRQESSGISAARNRGIQEACGEFVAFLDSDDVYLSEKLARSIEPLLQDPSVAGSFTDYVCIDETTGSEYPRKPLVPRGELFPEILYRNFIGTSTALVRKSVLVELGGFDPEVSLSEDWDLWIRLLDRFRLVYVNRCLTRWRLHEQSTDMQDPDATLLAQQRILQKTFARHPELDERVRRRALAYHQFRWGMRHYARFELREARRCFAEARRLSFRAEFLSYELKSLLPRGLLRGLRQRRLTADAGRIHGTRNED